MSNITIPNDGKPAFIYLTVPGWTATNYSTAAPVTFVCHGITKSNMDLDMGIFYAHPTFARMDTWSDPWPTDTHAPCFIVRFYPAELATFTVGAAYQYTFTTDKYSSVGTITLGGGDHTTIYGPSTSNEITVVISDVTVATQMTISAPSTGTVLVAFTISGTLKTTAGVGVSGQTIQLQKGGVDVVGKTATTDSTGAFSFSIAEAAAGTFKYKTTYAGATV